MSAISFGDATKAVLVALIIGKRIRDSLIRVAFGMRLHEKAFLARVRFRVKPNPSSRSLSKLREKWGQVRFWCTPRYAKKGPVPIFPASKLT